MCAVMFYLYILQQLFQVIYFQCIYSFDLQHFVCAHCEKPFEGRRHYEKKGLAYCERDYKFVSDLSADTT